MTATYTLRMTALFHSEMVTLEADPFEPTPEDPQPARVAFVAALDAARRTKRHRFLELTAETAGYLRWSIWCWIDVWEGWGIQGVGYARQARRIADELDRAFGGNPEYDRWRERVAAADRRLRQMV